MPAVGSSWTSSSVRPGPSFDALLLLLDLDEMLAGVSNAYNLFDDHYFNYPLYTYMTLDAIGWQFAPVLLRVCVRYLANEIVPPVRPNTLAALLRRLVRSVRSEAVGNGSVGRRKDRMWKP